MRKNFIHLHVHSEYSLLDGLLKINDLVQKAAEFEMPAVAITDHGNMYGVIEFYKSARKAGIKPIIGCEVYQAPQSRWNKKVNKDVKEDIYNHLTLLVKDKKGYQNLMKLVSLGFLEGFYYKPRVDAELLRQYSKGIIALSGCWSGKIPSFIQAGKIDEAKKALEEYLDIFGRENFYLELTDFGTKKHKDINKIIYELSKSYNIHMVCTNDVHYLNKEDFKYHFVLLCIQAGMTIGDFRKYCDDIKQDADIEETINKIILKLAEHELENKEFELERSEKSGFFPRTTEYYFKNFNQISDLFIDFSEAVENTCEIADRCNLDIDFNLSLIPPFKIGNNFNPDGYLKELCFEGANKKYKEIDEEIEARIKRELGVIKKMGFAEYFLIMWDLVKFAKNNDIRVGPGRGSAAGSIVSYLLDITDIEPLKYNLLFERFLNAERKNMPDIDIDFCDEKRDQIIKYVTEKYGENRVAQLITFGTMAARQAIRDAGRVLEVSYAEVDKIAKLVPMELNMTIDNSLLIVQELQELYNTDKKVREIIDTAKSLEGKARQHSIHAAGVVISAEELFNYTPIQRDDKSGEIKTQYKMEDIQEIGLLKMDFLGLKTLSLIDKTVFLVKKTRGIDIDINNISLEDKKTFEMLCNGDCLGVFQLESSGMRELVINLKPARFEDIIAILALFRPGPLQSGMVKDFIDAKNKNKKIKYFHSSLEPILKETYGIILYQEQIMLIASKLAGFSMSEADILRDAISKKKRDVMTKQKNKFIGGTKKVGIIDEITADKLFELITHFAEYGFNKSHSAAYAMISYQTGYLKANFPVEFMAALLSIRMGSQEKVAQYINETGRMGIMVLPPDINESFSDFTVVGNSIRFGLSAIKNVGSNVISSIAQERKNGRFKNFEDFCNRVSSSVLNKKTVESLIKAGVFDSFKQSRKYLLVNFERIVEEAAKLKRSKESGQFSLFDESKELQESLISGNLLYQTKRSATDILDEFSAKELLNFEKEMLGLYISGHPLAEYQEILSGFKTIESLAEENDKSTQLIAGVISSIKQILTKSNQPMYFITLEDITDSIEVIVFPTILEKYKSIIITDRIVRIKGKLDKKEDQMKLIAVEVEDIKSQKNKIIKENTVDKSYNFNDFKTSEDNLNDNIGYENNYSDEGYELLDENIKIHEEEGTSQRPEGEYDFGKIILTIEKNNIDKETINKLHEVIRNNPGSIFIELNVLSGDAQSIEKVYSFPSHYGINLSSAFFEQLKVNFEGKITWETLPDIK
jgi:DNA polymerase-3 subunit alpha